MKLSNRLKHIEQLVSADYTHIWDCCCDHGFLGTALLARQAAPHIHFVDIVPALMQTVEDKLQRFYGQSASAWTTHCMDVAALPLRDYPGKHLIIIAGVGGDLITTFIERIHQQYPHVDIDFLLCPVHHQFTLRQKLCELNFSLKHEVLVEDNQRFYEIIYVSSRANDAMKISSVGEKIWHAATDEQARTVERYLEKTLSHYRRVQRSNRKEADMAVAAYQAITQKN